MKKLTLVLFLIIVQALNAQNLDSLKLDYINCNKSGAILKQLNIKLCYTKELTLNRPFKIHLNMFKDGSCDYTVLVSEKIKHKRKALIQAFNKILKNEKINK